eukprot:GFUD01028216.1.p1 GENE.GFUD01028216.1~~GFUD01028216.1.p1  ORF type:complete len:258 (+),score=87.62 GFUD01028216.1:164-937(+)
MSEVLTVPESIVCSICSEVCKRGVKVDCCSAIACRSCATRSVTRNKTCWNGACAKQIKTGDLINDETLREEVDKYQTVKKEAEGKIKAEQEAKEKAEKEAVEEEKEGTTKKDAEFNNENESDESKKDGAPPPKKAKSESELMSEGISLAMMQERNDEFDRCMLPTERDSKELRFGAQLELMLEFRLNNASCLICGEQLKSEFIILKHLQLKHKTEYDQMKAVLGATNINTLNMFLHKAIRSEFLYQKKKVFPISVIY